MRIQLKSLLLAASVLVLGATFVEGAQPPFTVTIAPSGDAILAGSGVQRVGSPIFLLVKLANNSTRTVSIPSFDSDYYTIDVRDEHGKPVLETDEGRKRREEMSAPTNALRSRKTAKGLIGELKPHTTTRETMEVSRCYDMSHPGKYSIQLTRQLPEELGPGAVKSNAITVNVTP